MNKTLDWNRQIIFWILGLGFFCLFLWTFKGVLAPFVIGIAAAYLLNPLVNRLDDFGMHRRWVALIIVIIFYVFLLAAMALAIPILVHEISDVLNSLPLYFQRLDSMLSPYVEKYAGVSPVTEKNLGAIAQQFLPALSAGKTLLGGLKAGGEFVLFFSTILFLTPIVTYFMIKEWPRFTVWIEDLFPRHYQDTILDLLKKIDQKVAGFVRGQIIVMSVLAFVYAISLSLIGLQSGFIIGLCAGFLNIIPMVGSAAGLITGISVAWFQTGDYSFALLVAAVFLIGQLIEGNFLTPKLVGDRVGLHPLWVFFALMAGGSLLGVTGMFLAIPVTAILSVLAGFFLDQYRQSPYYTGKRK
jgi:predicted PurR-regulated permease PerM